MARARFGPKDLKGAQVPLITPLEPDRKTLDEEGTARLVEHVIGPNDKPYVGGLFANSFTGEFPWTTVDAQRAMLDITMSIADERVAVLAGVSASAAGDVRKRCEYAQGKGVDGVVLAPFSYHHSNNGVVQAVKEIAKDFPDLYFYLYNNSKVASLGPGRAEIDLTPGNYRVMLEEIENLGGIKVSTGVPGLYREFKKQAKDVRPDAVTMIGDETQIVFCDRGDPSVPSIGNFDSKVLSELYESTEFDSGPNGAQGRINLAGEKVYCGYKKIPGGLKNALNFLGICGRTCTNPYFELTAPESLSVWKFVENLIRKDYFVGSAGIA